MRTAALVVALILVASACTDEPFTSAVPAEDNAGGAVATVPTTTEAPPTTTPTSAPTTTPPTTMSPVSLPLLDTPIAPALPEGTTAETLPDEPGDRLELLTDWLEDNYEERSSGHAFSGIDGSYGLKFNINEPDGLYAQALCPFYVDLANLYMPDTEHTVALYGWVRTSSGAYEDAEWGTIDC